MFSIVMSFPVAAAAAVLASAPMQTAATFPAASNNNNNNNNNNIWDQRAALASAAFVDAFVFYEEMPYISATAYTASPPGALTLEPERFLCI